MLDNQRPRVDEEDDLDELDDVLDEFSGPSTQLKSPPSWPTPAVASTSAADTEDEMSKALGAEFAKQMDSFLNHLHSNIETSEGDDDDSEAVDRKFAAAWEATLVGGNSQTPAETSPAGSKQDDFQSRIRSTMNKLKESESGLKSSDTSGSSGGDTFDLESVLSQLGSLQGLSGDSDDVENDEQLQGMLEAMMGQLMSKEVLYEPLKELDDKFPEYLNKNSSTISLQDKERFEAQRSYIKQLLVEFEAPKYSDDNKETRKKIVDLMGELQSHGSPPEEIMGPLPPGFSMGTDGLPDVPEDCKVN